jgi:hypothetical protein
LTRNRSAAALKTVPTEELIERFIHEAGFTDPKVATTYEERAKHIKNVEAYADEIGRRDQLGALIPLLNSRDNWIAYSTADQLVQFDVTEACAMAALDRIADAESDGITSGFANRARNMVRFGDPCGAFKSPTELEREFLRVVTLGYQAAELQIETCLICEWDGLFLPIRVIDGPPMIDCYRILGPTVLTNRDDVSALESTFWVNDAGMIVGIAIEFAGMGTVSDPMSYFLEAARCAPERLNYRNAAS